MRVICFFIHVPIRGEIERERERQTERQRERNIYLCLTHNKFIKYTIYYYLKYIRPLFGVMRENYRPHGLNI